MSFELIRHDTNFDFVGNRKYAYALSAVLLLASVVLLLIKGGPRYGVDFAGGINLQIKFSQAVELDTLRQALDSPLLPGLVIQNFGDADAHEVMLRAAVSEATANEIREEVVQKLNAKFSGVGHEIQRLEMVGPKVGADLREKALQAIFYAVLLMATYISGRFEQRWMVAGLMAGSLSAVVYVLELLHAPTSLSVVAATLAILVMCVVLRLKYALGALIALIHDVLFPLGVFAFLNKEVDLTIIAAFMTIVGYSLNDTIIIYDRIRENMRAKTLPSLDVIINASVNQTLSRTIITGGTTLVAVLALYLFGGTVIQDFALVMILGVITGTYSSIFVASPVLRAFNPKIEEEPGSTPHPSTA